MVEETLKEKYSDKMLNITGRLQRKLRGRGDDSACDVAAARWFKASKDALRHGRAMSQRSIVEMCVLTLIYKGVYALIRA